MVDVPIQLYEVKARISRIMNVGDKISQLENKYFLSGREIEHLVESAFIEQGYFACRCGRSYCLPPKHVLGYLHRGDIIVDLRQAGIPDYLIWKEDNNKQIVDLSFVEVKRNDGALEWEQMNWILRNHDNIKNYIAVFNSYKSTITLLEVMFTPCGVVNRRYSEQQLREYLFEYNRNIDGEQVIDDYYSSIKYCCYRITPGGNKNRESPRYQKHISFLGPRSKLTLKEIETVGAPDYLVYNNSEIILKNGRRLRRIINSKLPKETSACLISRQGLTGPLAGTIKSLNTQARHNVYGGKHV